MFIRNRRDGQQTYFYLVHAERMNGLPRQHSFYLGKSLELTAQQWANVLRKVDAVVIDQFGDGDPVLDAVRCYCKRNVLLLKTANGVKEGRKLIRLQQKHEAEAVAEQMFWRGCIAAVNRAHLSKPEAAAVLGVTTSATPEQVPVTHTSSG